MPIREKVIFRVFPDLTDTQCLESMWFCRRHCWLTCIIILQLSTAHSNGINTYLLARLSESHRCEHQWTNPNGRYHKIPCMSSPPMSEWYRWIDGIDFVSVAPLILRVFRPRQTPRLTEVMRPYSTCSFTVTRLHNVRCICVRDADTVATTPDHHTVTIAPPSVLNWPGWGQVRVRTRLNQLPAQQRPQTTWQEQGVEMLRVFQEGWSMFSTSLYIYEKLHQGGKFLF